MAFLASIQLATTLHFITRQTYTVIAHQVIPEIFVCSVAAGGFAGLDPARPWVCFWATHALNVMGFTKHVADASQDIIAFLASCQHPEGGFAGGPGQMPHLAPTYAAGSSHTCVD